jgi:DNA-binding SARP family transcriptional activator
LLTVLALRGSMNRAEVRGTLWPDIAESASAGRLRNALWRLSGARRTLLEECRDSIRLSSVVSVDVHELFRSAAKVDAGLPAVDHHQFESDLLPDWDEQWLVVDRERIRQTRLHALERLSEDLLAAGRYGVALDAALAALQADPLRESAHRAVISVHIAEGNFAVALQQYDVCRRLMRAEMGVLPSHSLRALMSQSGSLIR